MKKLAYIVVILAAFLLSGCLPEERFWWSPAGDRAVILDKEELRLVTANGTLSPALEGVSQKNLLVKGLSWLPDGSGFVCQRERAVKTWDEAQPLISKDELVKIERWVPAVPAMLEAFVKLSNADTKVFDHVIGHMPEESRAAFSAAAMRVFEQDPALVKKILAPLPSAAAMLEKLGQEPHFTLGELCLVRLTGNEVASITTLHTSGPLRRVILPKVSPKHPALSFLSFTEGDEGAALNVMSLDGKSVIQVADNVTTAQWTPDGRHLIFTTPFIGSDSEVQTILRLAVLQESGALMKPAHEVSADGTQRTVEGPDRLKPATPLVTTLFPAHPAVAVLPDGSVLFASLPVTLPLLESAKKPSPLLYVVDPEGKSVNAVPTAPGDLPTELGFFTASPDGKRVAIVESGTDAVAVLTLATGHTQIISPAHGNRACRTKPAWRSASEVTFAAWSEQDKVTRWMAWSESGGLRSLSDSWPADLTVEWIRESKSSN